MPTSAKVKRASSSLRSKRNTVQFTQHTIYAEPALVCCIALPEGSLSKKGQTSGPLLPSSQGGCGFHPENPIIGSLLPRFAAYASRSDKFPTSDNSSLSSNTGPPLASSISLSSVTGCGPARIHTLHYAVLKSDHDGEPRQHDSNSERVDAKSISNQSTA